MNMSGREARQKTLGREIMTESFYHSTTDFLSDTSTIASEQVMSPSSEKKDDANAAQAPPTPSHERAAAEPAVVVPPHAYERSADTDALERVLIILSGMDERMEKMELYQARLAEDDVQLTVVCLFPYSALISRAGYTEMISNARSCQDIKQSDMRWIRELSIGHEFRNVRRRAYNRFLNRLPNFLRASRGRYRNIKSLSKLLSRLSTGVPMRGRESFPYASLTGLRCTSGWDPVFWDGARASGDRWTWPKGRADFYEQKM